MVVGLLCAVSLLTLATAPAAAAPTALGNCTDITAPGSYELTGNVTASGSGSCIDVAASDLALGGNGHTVRGEFHLDNADNVTLANLTVANGSVVAERLVGLTLETVTIHNASEDAI